MTQFYFIPGGGGVGSVYVPSESHHAVEPKMVEVSGRAAGGLQFWLSRSDGLRWEPSSWGG